MRGSAPGNNGQIQRITDNVDSTRTTTFSYDGWLRLKQATNTQWTVTETYDRYGNRNTQSAPVNFSSTADPTTNRLPSRYAYDAAGNMTYDGTNTLAYDGENRVISSTSGAASGAYTFDGNGLRVKKVSGSTTTVYIFSGSRVVAEYDNGAAVASPSREYIYSGSQLVATLSGGSTTYSHPDHLSTRVSTDSTGTIVRSFGHFPFGESWYETGNASKLKFTSYERDSESGNDYAIARSHVNRLARFSSPDQIAGFLTNPQSLNRYAYAGSDPINLVDPSGFCGGPPGQVSISINGTPQGSGMFTSPSCGAGGGGTPDRTELALDEGGGGALQQIKAVINAALHQARLSECLHEFFGRGTILTNSNLPYIDATHSTADITTMTGVGAGMEATGTIAEPVPAVGRGTAIIAAEKFSDLTQAERTYLHETANILAIQRFTGSGVTGTARAFLGPMGGPPTATQAWAQAHPGNDPDIGKQFERCVFQADTEVVVH